MVGRPAWGDAGMGPESRLLGIPGLMEMAGGAYIEGQLMGYSSGWKMTKKKCQTTMARVANQAS